MRSMFAICEQFAFDFDMKFNTQKSVVMRVGERYVCTFNVGWKGDIVCSFS